jgi:hypothetical protein
MKLAHQFTDASGSPQLRGRRRRLRIFERRLAEAEDIAHRDATRALVWSGHGVVRVQLWSIEVSVESMEGVR